MAKQPKKKRVVYALTLHEDQYNLLLEVVKLSEPQVMTRASVMREAMFIGLNKMKEEKTK